MLTQERGLEAYSISCGQSLLYNNIFPKHRVCLQSAARPACPTSPPAAQAALECWLQKTLYGCADHAAAILAAAALAAQGVPSDQQGMPL
jgi:hypothetical protein